MAGFDGVYTYFGYSSIVGFDGRTLGQCGRKKYSACATVCVTIRDARRNAQSNNFLQTSSRGYTGMINSGDGDKGVADYPYEFYKNWAEDPEGTREMVESFTRSTIGVDECPIRACPIKIQKKFTGIHFY